LSGEQRASFYALIDTAIAATDLTPEVK